MNAAPQLRGHGLFKILYSALRATHTKGLWAGVQSLWMGVIRYAAERGVTAAVYLWKARQVFHWRLSPRITEEEYAERVRICGACDTVKVVDDGRYAHQESRYCGSCGCKDWKWSELTVKNRRKGHTSYICVRLQFPEQAEQLKQAEVLEEQQAERAAAKPKAECKRCGGNGRGHPLEDWHETHGLLPAGMRGRP